MKPYSKLYKKEIIRVINLMENKGLVNITLGEIY